MLEWEMATTDPMLISPHHRTTNLVEEYVNATNHRGSCQPRKISLVDSVRRHNARIVVVEEEDLVAGAFQPQT